MTPAYDDAVIDFLIAQSQSRAKNHSGVSSSVIAEDVAIFDELDSLSVEEFARIYTIYLLGADATCTLGNAEQVAMTEILPLEDLASDGKLHARLALGRERWLWFAKRD